MKERVFHYRTTCHLTQPLILHGGDLKMEKNMSLSLSVWRQKRAKITEETKRLRRQVSKLRILNFPKIISSTNVMQVMTMEMTRKPFNWTFTVI